MKEEFFNPSFLKKGNVLLSFQRVSYRYIVHLQGTGLRNKPTPEVVESIHVEMCEKFLDMKEIK